MEAESALGSKTEDVESLCSQFVTSLSSSRGGGFGLSEEATAVLAADIKYRAAQLIKEAAQLAKRSKRTSLWTQDLRDAIALVENPEGTSFRQQLNPMHPRCLPFLEAAQKEGEDEKEEEEMDYDKLVPLPSAAPSLQLHWLALEGVQPILPQNPLPEVSASAAANEADEGVRHVLSRELQLYLDKVVMLLRSGEESMLRAALNRIKCDPGLHQLVPYFTRFLASEVACNLTRLKVLNRLIQFASALVDNTRLHLDPYLHQILQPVLTCLVGRRLCQDAFEDHWAMRDRAAELIAKLCSRMCNSYPGLQPQITRTLQSAFLDPTKPLTTHYGAIVGLTALGKHVIELALLPHIPRYVELLHEEADTNPIKTMESERCYNALLRATNLYIEESSQDWGSLSSQGNQEIPQAMLVLFNQQQLQTIKQTFGSKLVEHRHVVQ